ncbi:MAG: hypothetical protein SGI90_01825 [Candidatus Eisenbacteria bacterium]|mgnify:CR=1 FL=1|nr:hypothetical protein [Candidatus Eisenbacteria bacterium]
MAGGPVGGCGVDPKDPGAVADDAKAAKPPDSPGINATSDKAHCVDVKNHVSHTEGNAWLNVGEGKNEFRALGYFEFIVGTKHSVIQGSSSEIVATNSNARTYGIFASEMAAAKYEILGKKTEIVMGDKKEGFLGPYKHLTKGKYTSKNAKLSQERHVMEKILIEQLATKVGSLLEEKAKKCQQKVKDMDEKIRLMEIQVSQEMRLKAKKIQTLVKEMSLTIDEIKMDCGKFERRTGSMKEAVSSLMKIKGADCASKKKSMKLKAQVIKFTADLVKLGE